MSPIGGLIRWSWLLGIALCVPTALPAGGGERKMPYVRVQKSVAEPFLTENGCILRASPMSFAPGLRKLEIGTPIQILDYFDTVDGSRWIRIKLLSGYLEKPLYPTRGWVNV